MSGSRVALATTRFDAMLAFYRDGLRFPVTDGWERAGARGTVVQGPGLAVELLDALRDRHPFGLHAAGDRVHLVFEVPDARAAHGGLGEAARAGASAPAPTSWCPCAFHLRDPDGTAVWFVERADAASR
ncbi:MAG: VOC family protein [Phycisphaerales bacterium]